MRLSALLPCVALAASTPLLTGCNEPVLWLVQPGDKAAVTAPPAPLSDGSYLLGGHIYNSATAGDTEPLVELLGPNGEPRGRLDLYADTLRVEPTPDDRLAFAGVFTGIGLGPEIGIMNFNGTFEVRMFMEGAAATHLSPDGALFVAGATGGFGFPEDAFIKKVTKEGDEIWAYHLNQTYYNRIFNVVYPEDGGVILTGVSTDDILAMNDFVLRLDADGNEVWSRVFDSTSLTGIDQDPETGRIYVTGSVANDILIGALEEDGTDVFWNTFDGSTDDTQLNYETGWSISIRPGSTGSAKQIVVGGTFAEAVDFGLPELLTGHNDAFLLTMTTEGSPLRQMAAGSEGDDSFIARFATDGTILATLYCSTGGYDHISRTAHVGGKSFELRGIIDSAVMQIFPSLM